ncbi:MAG: hypothetical protein NUV98_06675 [Candidatus Roizmanbacteria bacterium]|nr:hypothetical protein [Candidatus Roizmanbacteria bacterium]
MGRANIEIESRDYQPQSAKRENGWQYVIVSDDPDTDLMPHTFQFPDRKKSQAERWNEMVTRPEIEQIEFVRNEVTRIFDFLLPHEQTAYRREARLTVTPEMIEASKLISPIKNYLNVAFTQESADRYKDFPGPYYELTCNVRRPLRRHVYMDMKLGLRNHAIDSLGPRIGSFLSADFKNYPRRAPVGTLRSYAEDPVHWYGWQSSSLSFTESPATETQFVLNGYMKEYPKLLIPSQLVEFARGVLARSNPDDIEWMIEQESMF